MSFSKILVASDFSESSERALQLAARLAQACGSKLVLEHVVQLPSGLGADALLEAGSAVAYAREASHERLSAEAATLASGGLAVELRVDFGSAAALAIVEAAADTGADLIVLGTHGRTGIARRILGSVAQEVLRMSPVPVLTTRGGAGEDRLDAIEQRLRDETEG